MKSIWKSVRIVAVGILCLAALYGYANAEGNLLGDGHDYCLAPGQLMFGGIYSGGTSVDGGVIQIAAENDEALPRLYTLSDPGAVSGVYARNASSEMIVSPSLTSGTMLLDFLCIDEGASVDLRFWENSGEFGFLNTQNPAVVISECADENGSILICVTRSCLSGNTVTGDCAVYRSHSGIVRLTGNYKSVNGIPAAEAALIGKAQWVYEIAARKLTASAVDEKGKYADIAYSAYVDNVLSLSGTGIAKASGVIQSDSDADKWRLKIAFPNAYEFQSPIYGMSGEIAVLCDASSFQTPFTPKAEATIPTPAEPTPPPVTTLPPEPVATVKPTVELPMPGPENPYRIAPDTAASFSKTGSPDIQITLDNLTFTAKASNLPAGTTLSRVSFTQVFSDGGFHMNMQNGYSSLCVFSAENGESKIAFTVFLTDSKGKETSVPAGTFLLTDK